MYKRKEGLGFRVQGWTIQIQGLWKQGINLWDLGLDQMKVDLEGRSSKKFGRGEERDEGRGVSVLFFSGGSYFIATVPGFSLQGVEYSIIFRCLCFMFVCFSPFMLLSH